MILFLIRRFLFRCRSAEKWKAVGSYSELNRVLRQYGLPATPLEFASGPLRRFFDLALEPSLSAGQRCRIIEFARQWASEAQGKFREPQQAEALLTAVQDETARLIAVGECGAWVLSVFESNQTHHAAPAYPIGKSLRNFT